MQELLGRKYFKNQMLSGIYSMMQKSQNNHFIYIKIDEKRSILKCLIKVNNNSALK
jgi:hypothetical protein